MNIEPDFFSPPSLFPSSSKPLFSLLEITAVGLYLPHHPIYPILK